MYLAFGMIVVGSDGVEVGTLDRALVDPARRQLTHVVVWSPRLQADVLVPLSLVQGSADRRLLLHSTSGALENMPRYEADRTGLPPFHRVVLDGVRETEDQRESLKEALELAERTLELGAATRGERLDGAEGQLVGPSSRGNDVPPFRGHRWRFRDRELVIPAPWVATCAPGWIMLGATRDHRNRSIGSRGRSVRGQAFGASAPRRRTRHPQATTSRLRMTDVWSHCCAQSPRHSFESWSLHPGQGIPRL